MPIRLPISPTVHLISVELRTEVISNGRNKRMQLCKERNRPHDVHGDGREDKRRAPDTVENPSAPCPHLTAHHRPIPTQRTARSPHAAGPVPLSCADQCREDNLRLVLALGRKEPCSAAEQCNHHQPDERSPATLCQSPISPQVCCNGKEEEEEDGSATHPFAMMIVYACTCVCVCGCVWRFGNGTRAAGIRSSWVCEIREIRRGLAARLRCVAWDAMTLWKCGTWRRARVRRVRLAGEEVGRWRWRSCWLCGPRYAVDLFQEY
jgi:hypothetical protein